MPAHNDTPRFDPFLILNLQPVRDQQLFTESEIKTAYRQALLRHHPDKSSQPSSLDARAHRLRDPSCRVYSVDDIKKARDMLLDALLGPSHQSQDVACGRRVLPTWQKHAEPSRVGSQIIDLADMDYQIATGVYTYPCRCGNNVGFRVKETELQKESEVGEVNVLCAGCSLVAKVVFEAVEE